LFLPVAAATALQFLVKILLERIPGIFAALDQAVTDSWVQPAELVSLGQV
jgi:hypothetical protein